MARERKTNGSADAQAPASTTTRNGFVRVRGAREHDLKDAWWLTVWPSQGPENAKLALQLHSWAR